ncbi:MAG: hypothetical protein ACLPYW_17440 [Acidimicrobiales bacterium]
MGAQAFKPEAGDTAQPLRSSQPPRFEPDFEAPRRDRLAEIDLILQRRMLEEAESADRNAQVTQERADFSNGFAEACASRVRPVMEAILERLRENGGGGFIEEREEARSRLCSHRLILWMSLSGEIEGVPRQNRHPYLQLDADPESHMVMVSEGDMWQGHGGNRSGLSGQWSLPELTPARVTESVVDILRRAAQAPA